MKSVRLLLTAVCTLLFLAACDASGPRDARGRDRTFPDTVGTLARESASRVVATVNAETGKVTLRKDRLRKSFRDGGPIHSFQVVKLVDGYNLIRNGKTADGACRTDAIWLNQTGFDLKPTLEPAHTTLCTSRSCESPETGSHGSCEVDFDKKGCLCSLGGDCMIASLQSDELDAITR